MDNVIYRLWLKNATSNSQARKLISKYKTAQNVYEQTDYSHDSFLPEKSLANLADKSLDRAKNILNRCKELDIQVLTPESEDYPIMLKDMTDLPCVLFSKGNIPDWNNIITIGVVGTRRISIYGKEVTELLSRKIAQSGGVIVSGFASGADTIAATAATQCNAPTIAVLGCGIDIVYPAHNKSLYNKVLEKGLFVSEHEPGTKPVYFNFPVRNRIIVGLSRCVLVTEAPKKSGAILTAQMAMKKNKPVFTVPGQINRSSCDGTNLLMKQGAITVFGAEDILSSFPQLHPYHEDAKSSHEPETDPILKALNAGDMNMDQLCAATNLSVVECNSRCFMLELAGKIQKLPANYYHKL